MKYTQKYGRSGNSTTLLRHCNAVYNQNTIDKKMHPLLPSEGRPRITKNYRGITITSIAAKIYNALLRKRIEPKMRRYLGRTKIDFGEINPQRHKFSLSVEF